MDRSTVIEVIKAKHAELRQLYTLLESTLSEENDDTMQTEIKRKILDYLLTHGENTKDNYRVIRMDMFYPAICDTLKGMATKDTIKAVIGIMGFTKIKKYSNKDNRQHWSYSINRDAIHILCNDIGIADSETVNGI